MPFTNPPLLAPGARVALVAPAGPLRDPADLERAASNAHSLGWEPVVGEHALDTLGYLAGSDEARASDLNRALRDPRVDGIWCIRGGYGSARILDALDYDALRAHPRAIIGYSDITALHAAVAARTRIVGFHGPTARAALSSFSRDSLLRAVALGADPCGRADGAQVVRGGCARGRLVGGNLALITSLVGTPYAVDFDDAILVVEDVNEPVYRIDRMLLQLQLAGALAKCRGLVLGQFTERDESEAEAALLDSVLARAAEAVGGPCLANVPVGHVADQWTLPLGRVAELDADARTLHIEPAS